MNYRHSYHAGSFADVFKHSILILLLKALLRKETPFCYLDTHAGSGCYDLASKEANINKEFELGISKVLSHENPPEIIKDYIHCIQKLNTTPALTLYPGSPLIAKTFLRSKDRLILCELHPEEYRLLKKSFRNNKQIAVHQLDGYLGLNAFLPPKEHRGLVLIDPPYEKLDDFEKLGNILPKIIKKWINGLFAIWYPIKQGSSLASFLKSLKETIPCPILNVELIINPIGIPNQLVGCGMIIINPPWKIEDELHPLLTWIAQILSINGHYELKTN